MSNRTAMRRQARPERSHAPPIAEGGTSPTRPAAQLEEPAEQLDSADQRMQCVG